MNLDFFKLLKNELLENKYINQFLKDLSNYLENINNELGIIEQVKDEKNISEISENKMLNEQNKILKNYANKTKEEGALYFISSKSKSDNKYTVFKYENNKESTIKIEQNKMPENIVVNSILRKHNDKYILDNKATEVIKNEIEQMVNKVIENQDKKLEDFRQENHLYLVEEDRNNRIYLKDLTIKSDYVLEEVNFPKTLLDKAAEGTIFKYEKGEYKFYSNDKYERLYGKEK